MALNSYFTHGTAPEQNLLESLIIESIQIWGKEFLYIPRVLVAKDEILGEDRLSRFENAYPIECYLEAASYNTNTAMLQKFGLVIQQTATLTVARKRWDDLIGSTGNSILPNRPAEGDLLYFPMTKSLFEIKFVESKQPFYQLGKLYVYRLEIELFQYASEKMDTGVAEIDEFETLKTFSTDVNDSNWGGVFNISMTNVGAGYTTPTISFTGGSGTGAAAVAVMGSGATAGKIIAITMTNNGTGYLTIPTVVISGSHTTQAVAVATIRTNIDLPDNFGDNNALKAAGSTLLNIEADPFGEISV